jgi:hypothetical protein
MRAALLATLLVSAFPVAAQQITLVDFELEDQFGQVYTDEDFAGTVLVLIGGDRKGSRYTGGWTKAIQSTLPEHLTVDDVRFVGLADLRGVPFFIKGLVKSKFPQQPENWVLMDWKGQISKTYAFEPHSANILIFDRDRLLVRKTHGQEVDDDKALLLAGEISALPASSPD